MRIAMPTIIAIAIPPSIPIAIAIPIAVPSLSLDLIIMPTKNPLSSKEADYTTF
jgi:hypothetical protein